jgi:hypothetical protein
MSTQVQRTLVKSAPELWAELSDPAALAKHLGELGEIRITRIEPERKVEWMSQHASGTVLINASGWGTRVTLTASRKASEPPPAGASVESGEQQAPANAQPIAGPLALGADTPAPAAPHQLPDARAPQASATGDEAEANDSHRRDFAPPPGPPPREALAPPSAPAAESPDSTAEQRRGVFGALLARLRRGKPTTPLEPQAPTGAPAEHPDPAGCGEDPERDGAKDEPHAAPPGPQAGEPENQTTSGSFPPGEPARGAQARQLEERGHAILERAFEAPPDPAAIAACDGGSPASADAANPDEAVLTAVLDSLGSAHHRPFSRA